MFLSNLIITLFTLVLVAVLFFVVINNYVKDNILDDLVTHNNTINLWLESDKLLYEDDGILHVKLDAYNEKVALNVEVMVLDLESFRILGQTDSHNDFDDLTLLDITDRAFRTLYRINMFDENYYAYNDVKTIGYKGQSYHILVVTLLANDDVSTILEEMSMVVIVTLVFIASISLIVYKIVEYTITKPITELSQATEAYANKAFDVRTHIDTGDELESLSIAMNNMAENLCLHEMKQKKFYETISHELKTPITVLSGYAQGLKSGVIDKNDAVYDAMIEESQKMKAMLEDLIYLSKLASIQDTMETKPLVLEDVIGKVLNDLYVLMVGNKIDIIFEPTDRTTVMGDQNQLERLFSNILTNCIKYADQKIHVSVGDQHIIIRDDGSGFDDAILSKPFQHHDVGLQEGTGIGLSIVKKIVDHHMWSIDIYNDEGAVYRIDT